MNENFDVFDDYAMTFDMNEEHIAHKFNHSYRVVHQAEEISRSLSLDEEESNLASLIALLHDIGRFNQWTKYKTFSDGESIDHGMESNRILFEEGLIKKFKHDKKDEETIKNAIYYHNKFNDEDLSDRDKMHADIVRDADKLDILYAMSTGVLLPLPSDDSEISPKVAEDFMKHKLISYNDVKTINDKVLLKFALIYDLNFDYSNDRVKREKYINKIYNGLKNKKIFKKYIDELNLYLKEKKKC